MSAIAIATQVNADGSSTVTFTTSHAAAGLRDHSGARSEPRRGDDSASSIQTDFPNGIPPPDRRTTPSPDPTSVPNPWIAAGIPNGTMPNPLESDTFTSTAPSRRFRRSAPFRRGC